MNLMSMVILSVIITLILMYISIMMEKKILLKKESSKTFECGFDSSNNKSKMISSQFFSIAILFLIFDVEIGFIVPIPLSEMNNMSLNWNIFLIMMIFLMSTMMEWKMGMIEWMK